MKEPLQLVEAAGAHGAPGTLVLVGNEIGLGVIPMGRERGARLRRRARQHQPAALVSNGHRRWDALSLRAEVHIATIRERRRRRLLLDA